MDKTLEKLYALRAQMDEADLPLDAIDEKIRVEEEKASSWQKDLDEIASSVKTFIQPIIKKWGASLVDIQARFKDTELSTLLMNLDGKNVVICQDSTDVMISFPHSKRMKEAIEVHFPDGFVIFEPQASVTLGKAIERIGPEKVEPLQIQGLISKNPDDFKAYQTINGEYFVNTHSNTDTKRKQLEEISRRLGLKLVVNVVPGVYKSRKSGQISDDIDTTLVSTDQLLDELENEILSLSPSITVDRSLKSYRQFSFNSQYVANVIPRKKFLRVMLNDEYDRLEGMEGVIEAPDAHYGHMNRYVDVYKQEDITTVTMYINKMLSLPEDSDIPNKIRIRLDRTTKE